MYPFSLCFLLIALVASTATAWASEESELEARLELFKKNSKAYLERIPEKKIISGPTRLRRILVLDSGSEATPEKKIDAREKIRGNIKSGDRAEDLVENADQMVTTLEEMDSAGLRQGAVSVQPWSDSYWALYNGQLAFRYADPNFPADSKSWNVKNKYLTGEGATLANSDLLSPAEKYDLLVGDREQSLTRSALASGEYYYRETGKVETWMGICDGWSPASYRIARPKKAIEVKSADGTTTITFYPSDLKALGSLLWSEHSPDVRFVGGRCDAKKPETDANGRILDQDCFDTNPGTWHLAIVNQVGVVKKAFVMDSTFDEEVWNQPVKGYSYSYFNPQTLRAAKTLEKALIPFSEITQDKFAEYRPSRTRFLVGISMKVDYMEETDPSTAKTDGPKNDAITQVTYEYDLELDRNMNIIGGEWYRNAHPDFLWTPKPGLKAITDADKKLDAAVIWNGKSPLPGDWAKAAIPTAQEGSPLRTIVKALVKLSRAPR